MYTLHKRHELLCTKIRWQKYDNIIIIIIIIIIMFIDLYCININPGKEIFIYTLNRLNKILKT